MAANAHTAYTFETVFILGVREVQRGSWKQRDCVHKDIEVGKTKGREGPSSLVKTWQFMSPKEKTGVVRLPASGSKPGLSISYLNWGARMH
jgi:hypothetical protein